MENIATVEDVIKSLPLNTKGVTMNTWIKDIESSKRLLSKGRIEVEKMYQELGNNVYPIPQWLNEAFITIDSWLKYPHYPQNPVLRKNFSTLEIKIKKINQSATSKIIIDKNGATTYSSAIGTTYNGYLKPNSNSYKLLKYLSTDIGKVHSAIEINKVLNKTRRGANEDPKRRVTDTITSIRENLRLHSNNDIFIVSNGYGLKYPILFTS